MATRRDPADYLSPRAGYRLSNDPTDVLGRITARAPAAGCLGTADTESDRSTTPAGEDSGNCSPAPTPLQGFFPILDTFSPTNAIEFPILNVLRINVLRILHAAEHQSMMAKRETPDYSLNIGGTSSE